MTELDVDRFISILDTASERLSPAEQKVAQKLVSAAIARGMPEEFASGPEGETRPANAQDAISFFRNKFSVQKKTNAVIKEAQKLYDELKKYNTPPTATTVNPYAPDRRGYKNTKLPRSVRRELAKKYPERIRKFREMLRQPDLPVPLRTHEPTSYISDEFVGPQIPESFYGPTKEKATGFEYHATQARINAERAAKKEKIEQAKERGRKTLAEMRSKRNFAWQYHHVMTDKEREMFDTTMMFGGGHEGRRMASEHIQSQRDKKAQEIHKERRSRDRRESIAAEQRFKYDMMDEFDQRMADLTKRYGGDKTKADESLRNQLKKELPSFFKNSKMSTKNLHKLSQLFSSAGRLPVVGQMFKHPTTAAIPLIMAAQAANDQYRKSAVSEMSLQASIALVGPATKQFINAASGLGLSSDKIQEEYANIISNYGSVDVLRGILSSIPAGIERVKAAQSLGLNPNQVYILDKMFEGGKSETESVASFDSALSDLDKYGMSPSQDFSTKMASLFNNRFFRLLFGNEKFIRAGRVARAKEFGYDISEAEISEGLGWASRLKIVNDESEKAAEAAEAVEPAINNYNATTSTETSNKSAVIFNLHDVTIKAEDLSQLERELLSLPNLKDAIPAFDGPL